MSDEVSKLDLRDLLAIKRALDGYDFRELAKRAREIVEALRAMGPQADALYGQVIDLLKRLEQA